jgi:hypothetical protein
MAAGANHLWRQKMDKIVALFPSQAEATRAVDVLTSHNLDVKTRVVEGGVWDDSGALLDTPPLFPDDDTNPFIDVDLGTLDDESADYLASRVRRGAALVVVDVPNEVTGRVRDLFQQLDGQVYGAS